MLGQLGPGSALRAVRDDSKARFAMGPGAGERLGLADPVADAEYRGMTRMRRRDFIAATGSALLAGTVAASAQPRRDRVLYCTHSAGYRHDSVPLSHAVMQQLGEASGLFAVEPTEDVTGITRDN